LFGRFNAGALHSRDEHFLRDFRDANDRSILRGLKRRSESRLDARVQRGTESDLISVKLTLRKMLMCCAFGHGDRDIEQALKCWQLPGSLSSPRRSYRLSA
jgi:hypothetical protein